MARATALADGAVAGAIMPAALAVFALGRPLNSIASKDVLARRPPRADTGGSAAGSQCAARGRARILGRPRPARDGAGPGPARDGL